MICFLSILSYLPPTAKYEIFMFLYYLCKIWNARRGCLILGSLLFTLAPVLTHFTLLWGVPAVCFSYGVVRILRRDGRRIEHRVQTILKVAFPTDGSRSHKHHHAPFNTHPCHMVSRTQRPGRCKHENPIFVSNWLTSKTKKTKPVQTTIYSHQGVGHCHLWVWSLLHCILSPSDFPHQPKQLESHEGKNT